MPPASSSDNIHLSVLGDPYNRRNSRSAQDARLAAAASSSVVDIRPDHNPYLSTYSAYDEVDGADDYPSNSRHNSYQYSQADDYPSNSRPVSYVPSLRHFPSAGEETLRHQPSNISEFIQHDFTVSEEVLANTNQTVVELDHFPSSSNANVHAHSEKMKIPSPFSNSKRPERDDESPIEQDREFDDAMSQLTLTGGLPDGPFDFERFLRKLMKR